MQVRSQFFASVTNLARAAMRVGFAASVSIAFTGCATGTADDGGAPESGVVDDSGVLDSGVFDGGALDSGPSDAGVDGGANDAGALDAGVDSGVVDGGPARPGFGTISGACGEIDDELLSALPEFFENAIDFGTDPFDDPEDVPLLTPGGQAIVAAGNAGGSSIESEIFAFEVLARCEGAELLKTETAIQYVDAGKITDLLVQMQTLKVGVSVTRAVAFPFDDPYPFERAESLLNGKLSDILVSSALVAPEDAWVKQILHVVAYAPEHVPTLRAAWDMIDPAIKGDTIVVVTVTNGDDAFIY